MKRILSVTIALVAALSAVQGANPKAKIAGTPLAKYTVVYSSSAESEEGADAAAYFCGLVSGATGVELSAVTEESAPKARRIVFTNSQRAEGIPTPLKPFDYSISVKGGNVTIDAGGCWAMQKASRIIADQLAAGSIASNYKCSGTVDGEFLFPRGEGVNLRILDDNIWDFSKETIPAKWQEAGVAPRDNVRAPEFAQLVRAYMPDVFTMQEYNRHLDYYLAPLLKEYGYVNTYESGSDYDNTPVFYNPETLELQTVNFHLFTPAKYSNHGSKSFTSAVFKHKGTGRIFAVISTHLWWKSDRVLPGSTQARASQVRLIMAEAEEIRAAFRCPVFVVGDMNCEEDSIPMKQFIDGGYVPCYKAASVYGDTRNGHHICGPDDGYSRISRRKGEERSVGAIDHCLIWNDRGTVDVKTFDCITAEFTVKLTDHYPNLIDVELL